MAVTRKPGRTGEEDRDCSRAGTAVPLQGRAPDARDSRRNPLGDAMRLKWPVSRLLNIMAKAPASSSPDATPASYEAAVQELEQLVSRLESGDMPLEQLLGGYQRGALLLQFCRDKLQAVENQISVLDAGTLKTWMPE